MCALPAHNCGEGSLMLGIVAPACEGGTVIGGSCTCAEATTFVADSCAAQH